MLSRVNVVASWFTGGVRVRKRGFCSALLEKLEVHAETNGSSTAIIENFVGSSRKETDYKALWEKVKLTADALSQAEPSPGRTSPRSNRVGFLCQPGSNYVITLFAIWRCGYVAVPLSPAHPAKELDYIINDGDVDFVLAEPEFIESENHLQPLALENQPVLDVEGLIQAANAEEESTLSRKNAAPGRAAAYLIYTSGTTGRPKGVVHTHKAIEVQVNDLVSAWKWQNTDHILHFLPLHHVHGVVNKLLCCLYAGAVCEFIDSTPESILSRLVGANALGDINLFMAVPTVYARLIEAYHKLPKKEQEKVYTSCQNMRLMVSGSAALPTGVMKEWERISGHTLLERYGMTEFCMALSNPLTPVEERHPGCVGLPLPSVEVRICGTSNPSDVAEVSPGTSGELRVKGKGVFKIYHNRPEETESAFDDEGYFMTGDIARYNSDLETYEILGRASVDIIKSGGYKISALEVERHLLDHPCIAEVSVIGLVDPTWGENVVAVVRLTEQSSGLELDDLRQWASKRIASYKLPTKMHIVEAIQKNAIGKINKKELAKNFEI